MKGSDKEEQEQAGSGGSRSSFQRSVTQRSGTGNLLVAKRSTHSNKAYLRASSVSQMEIWSAVWRIGCNVEGSIPGFPVDHCRAVPGRTAARWRAQPTKTTAETPASFKREQVPPSLPPPNLPRHLQNHTDQACSHPASVCNVRDVQSEHGLVPPSCVQPAGPFLFGGSSLPSHQT